RLRFNYNPGNTTYLVPVAESKNRRCHPCPCFRRGKLVPAKAGSRGPERKNWIPTGVHPAHDAGRE
ncbi:MAG: hypothetical protein ABIL62_05090, partial [Planctomycetota bacterium]